MLKIGVTGTDTAVGKTVIASALVGLLRARGVRTAVMKPVETGVSRGEAGSDHVLLAVAADVSWENRDICPVVLDEPLAPWVASRAAGGEISDRLLDESFARLCAASDCVVVEGAGGLLAPISRTLRFDHLFSRWGLELVIVAADRLGALNHSLLTIEAAQRAGLRVRGVVVNQLHSAPSTIAGMRNANALRELVPDIPVVEFPCVEGLHGVRRLHAVRAPLDLGLLRDVALATGLANVLLGPA